jgi:hypothetical protein
VTVPGENTVRCWRWDDPAFDVTELVTHVACKEVPAYKHYLHLAESMYA